MMLRSTLLICLLALLLQVQAKKDYTGYHLLQVIPKTAEHVNQLRNVSNMVDFWTPPVRGKPTAILASPEVFTYLSDQLPRHGIELTVANSNIQSVIDNEASENEAEIRRRASQLQNGDTLDVIGVWARYEQIMAWIDATSAQYPAITSTQSIGKSYEGRDLKLLKIGSAGANKPSLWISCTLHAREWLSVASCNWMIKQILEGYSSNTQIKNLVDKYDWFWLPLANPDGYEHSHTQDRMWRKTRSPTDDYDIWGYRCYGVDPNRNWDHYWNSGIGTSSDGCSDTYKGPSPFSEPATKAISEFVKSQVGRMKMFIDIHTYSEMWLTPWGHTTTRPDDAAEIDRVASIACDALKAVHGTDYYRGTPGELLYDVSGGSFDWAKVAGVKYAYALELRPDYNCLIDPFCNGFIVERNQIVPTGQETLAAMLAAADALPA